MNSFLAEMYGTRETIGAPVQQNDDVEKLAEAQLLDEALRAENIDVDTLSPDQILKVASTLFGADSALVKAATAEAAAPAPAAPVTDQAAVEAAAIEKAAAEKLAAAQVPATEPAQATEPETAETKLAEADFLGRVMAHSFTQERAEIEKSADFRQAVKNWGQLAGHGAHVAGEAASHAGKSIKDKAKGIASWAKEPAHTFKANKEHAVSTGEALKRTIRKHPGQAAAAGGAAAGAAGALGFGAHKAFGHKKEGSALDKLAEQRALQILEENGVSQTPTDEEKLAAAVEERAYEILQENGYVQE
jgi:hypothetical protein